MASQAFRDLASEGVLLLGGARAILLQVADPVVGAGVAAHSDFANRPVHRLDATLRYVYAVVLGDAEAAHSAPRHVNRAHGPVNGAFDPERQRWVAATLYDTAVLVQERVSGPIPHPLAEEMLREYAALGVRLQMPVELWPTDRAAFAEYWREAVEGLVVGDDARRIAQDLLHPPHPPLLLRVALPLVRLVTAGLLPGALREAYGLPWSARRARRYARVMGAIAVLNRMLPRRVRTWPARRYLAGKGLSGRSAAASPRP